MTTSCEHSLGHYDESGYEYSETYFVSKSSTCLESLKKMKETGFIYNFCPLCGTSLKDVVDNKISAINKEIEKDKRAEAKKAEKERLKIEKHNLEVASSLGILNLEENTVYAIRIKSFHYPTKAEVMAGDKSHLIRTLGNYARQYKNNPEIIEVLLVPSEREFIQAVQNKFSGNVDWNKDNNFSCVFNEGEYKTVRVCYGSSGSVYINTTKVDEYGDKNTNYANGMFYDIHKYFNLDKEILPLQRVSLSL